MNGNVSCFDTERMTHTGNSQIVTKLWNMNGRATLPQDGFLRKGREILTSSVNKVLNFYCQLDKNIVFEAFFVPSTIAGRNSTAVY